MIMKQFNTTGVCLPDRHYMVDVTERVESIRQMIEHSDYFCINRGRQYGKTTTLDAIQRTLEPEYLVLSISFEGLGQSNMESDEAVARSVVQILNFQMEYQDYGEPFNEVIREMVKQGDYSLMSLSQMITRLCHRVGKPIVLLIDEVDNAANYESFLHFLGMLRNKYLNRVKFPTFQSVILAGVYDIKNLKLKIRDEQEHQYNSPWNIAVPFDIDMSLHVPGIADMLREYAQDHQLTFDANEVAQSIYDYTGGYPFLVSRLCQLIEQKNFSWNAAGVVNAVHELLNERNTLFDDLVKKIEQYPDLRRLLIDILFGGEHHPYMVMEKYMQLGEMFSLIRNDQGTVRLANRIFETLLYNLFTVEMSSEQIFREGSIDKNQFIADGHLNVQRILERFVQHFNDIYGNEPKEFLEKEGRRLFLLYLRPIINGVGNYYVEAETRDETRTDIIIDYLAHQYIIELKIWRGNSYNERGEKQLAEYLDYYHLTTGYLVSFSFNKSKQPGVHEVLVEGKKLIEALV